MDQLLYTKKVEVSTVIPRELFTWDYGVTYRVRIQREETLVFLIIMN
jgi:hypothetical protein